MSCLNRVRNQCYRSAQTAYNDSAQTFLAAGGTISVLGNQVCDTGSNIVTSANGFTLLSEGLYRVSYDIAFSSTAAGIANIQMYNGLTALPCSTAQIDTSADGAYTVHVETTLMFHSCYGNRPVISCNISGTPVTVTHVCASVVKL